MGVGFNSGLGKSVGAFQDQFNQTIDQSGMFERHMVNLTTETTRFGKGLEAGSLRLGQLFKAATEYRRGELGQIRLLAREQVRMMNSTTMRMADGTAQVIVPRGIDEGIEKQRILNQEYRALSQVVRNGSTEIINWGKNTQWAGRQLTVGLTVPLTIFGAAAGKMFMDVDKQLTRLTKVYGDASKGMVDPAELAKIRSETLALSQEIAKGMGVAVEETLGVAADIAATGKEGAELLGATKEAMRLSVLGEVDRQEAMKATLSIQSVFKKDTEGLAESINFLNAVENQTSTTLNDLVVGIVKAGPVVQGLGGDVEDLAAMMVAMREGGVAASEAANAIKSSLASLINPTKQTTQVLGEFGIDINSIVDKNAGDVVGTLMDLQSQLSQLDELSRQRSIEQIFGKFQFSRINALLANLGQAGSQTEKVFSAAGMSVKELAMLADAELTAVVDSATGKFKRSVETIKANLIPIGEVFITAGTIILNIGNKILEVFNSLPDPVKNIVNAILGLTAVAGPVIMITGVLGNFFGYLVKGISTIMAFKKEGRGVFELLTVDSIAARDANELLSESLYDQATAMGTMALAVESLVAKLQDLVNSMKNVNSAGNDMAQSMANAEASTFSRSATPYTTPAVNFTKVGSEARGYRESDVQYSHLTAESHLLGTEGLGAKPKATLGLGTFVQGQAAVLQSRLKDMVVDLLAIPSEAMATDEIRKAELLRIAQRHHTGNQVEFEKTAQIINSLSSDQLSQILPSWEKISVQTSQYAGIMSSAAKAVAQGNAGAAKALDEFKNESISLSPEKALQNLRTRLKEAGVSVESEIEEIASIFRRIAQEASQVAPGPERAEFLLERLKNPNTGVIRYETNAQDILGKSPVAGFDKQSGFNRVLMIAIQSLTDAYFNEAMVSEELALAAKSTADARQKLDIALLDQVEANKNEKESTEKLEKAKIDAQNRLNATYKTGSRDLSNITRRVVVAEDGTQNVEWLRDGKKISNSQKQLINSLNAWHEASVEAGIATEQVSETTKLVVQSQSEYKLINDSLITLKKNETEELKALAMLSDELFAATVELAASRREAALIKSEEKILEKANNELAIARSKSAKAEQKRLQAQLTYGFDSPEAKAASESAEKAKKILAQKELEAAGLEDKLNELREKRIINLQKQQAQEQKVIELRSKEATATQRNIVSTDRDTVSTGRAAASEDAQTAANLRNVDATNKDTGSTSKGGGLLAGGKIGGAISLASMAAMFLPRPGEDTGAGQAMNAGINTLNMAGMGAMFGGPGIAIGAGIGAAIEGIKFLGRKAEEEAAEFEELRMQTNALKNGLTDLERSFFEIDPLKGLEDGALGGFKLRTQEATDRLREFALAVKNAETGTIEAGRRDAISQMSTAEEFINNPMFSKMVSEALLGGKSIEDIKIMLGGYLDAAGKEVFTPLVNAELTRIGKLGKKPEEIGARYLAQLQSIANRVIESAGYDERTGALRVVQQDYERNRAGRSITVTDEAGNETNANLADVATFLKDTAERNNTTLQEYIGYLTAPEGSIIAAPPGIEEVMSNLKIDGETMRQNEDAFDFILSSASSLIAISPDLAGVKDIMGAIGNESQLMADGIENALGSGAEIFDEFLRSLGHTADSMNENTQLVSEMSSRIGQVSTSAKTAFDVMISNEVELQDALRIVSMLMSDAGTDWAQLADLALANPINFRNIIWTEYVTGGNPTPGSVPSQGATGSEDVGSRLAGTIDYSAGGGGGSSGSDYYDKLIEAQDKIIEGIQKEREERQKLLDIQEKQMDFALRRQDLENQIARAMAEGNLAEAALLQAELDAEQKKYDNEELERKRQEREDKKIETAEKEKERLSKLKEAASGGGGGSAGGVSESEKQWTANRIEIISTGVVNWTAGAELRSRTAEMGPYSAFFESEKVKQYREELLRLGVPLEDINRELNNMFDSWIDNNSQLFAQTDDYKFIEDSLKNMGVAGEDLKEVMPDVFGALLDKELNPKEKIDVIASALYDLGYETDEAYRKAKKMYEQYNKDFDGKGIDDELKNWLELNNRIRAARKQLKLYQEGKGGPVTADQAERTAQRAAGQEPGVPAPGTINAGGVQIDPESVGIDMIDGVVLGWTGQEPQAILEIQSIAKTLLGEFAKEAGVESPSWKYKLIGKDMIAGLIEGLTLPEDNVTGVISTLNDTFKAAADSYKVLFGDPTNGIAGVMDQEVTLASDNFFTKMTTRMQETVDEINRIVGGIKDYQFSIIGNPKIYTGGAPDIWTRVFQNVPASMFTNELPKYNIGGYVSGPGGPTEDKILAQLSNGEYVIKASSVKQYGKDLLDDINNRKFANGGYVSADRAEYAANNRTTYYGGTPTYSGGYRPTTPTSTYSGGTPTYSGGYTQANYQAYSQQRDKLNIQSFSGANWAWDQSKGKWIKLADVKTGAAASGFGLMASGLKDSVDQHGFWGSLGMLGSSIKEDPAQMLPFVGSSRIDTSTEDGKDLFSSSSLLDVLSFVPGLSVGSWAGRALLHSARLGSEVGMNTAQDSVNNSVNNDTPIAGGGFLERPLPPAPTPYIRPTLRPTSDQIKKATESGVFNLRNVPDGVSPPFDPKDSTSSTVGLPFATGRDRRVGIFPKGTRNRSHDDPTDYGPNGRVITGYTDAWALYVAMSSNDLTGGTYHPNSVRQGPGMKDVQDILPEYHTMGPARARGFNYGLIKIFGNLENAIRWGIKPMAIDSNPTLEEVPGSRPYDQPEAPALLRYKNPGMSIDTEVYPSDWDQMSTEAKIIYKTGRVLGYNKGLGYTTEKSLIDLPELGRVPFIIDSMIEEYETTPLGLASKLSSDQTPTFSFNKPEGIQNDFAAYQDPSGRVWSNREILNNRKEFPIPIYPAAPGQEELNPFQSAVQNSVDTASIVTVMSDLAAKYVIRGALGAVFPDDPKGAGFRSAIGRFANGEIDLPTAVILGAISSFNPTWQETEGMKPSNWAQWSSDPIYSDEWMKQFLHLTGQKDEFGNSISNKISKPGIPIGTLGSNFPNNTGNRGTPLRPVPKKTTFPDWGTGVPRRGPGFPTWGTGSNRGTYPSGSGSVRGYSSVLDGNAMTPRLYSAYLRAKSQGRQDYSAPLVNPYINDMRGRGYGITATKEAEAELPAGTLIENFRNSLELYSPEFLEQLLGIELDPSNRLTVDSMIKLASSPIELLNSEQYASSSGPPGSSGVYMSSLGGTRILVNTTSGTADPEFAATDIMRTVHHENRHRLNDFLLGGNDVLGRSYAQGNTNPFFNQSFMGIKASNSVTGGAGGGNSYFDDKGNSYGRGMEEASASQTELIILKALRGSGFDIPTDYRPLYTSNPQDLPYNMLNGQLSYQALHYLTQMDNPNSVLTKDDMKYLNTQASKQFVDNMDGRIDVPKNLNPLELAYHYAPTSVRERMLELNPNLKAAWTGKEGGMVGKFAKGGLARVGQENLTLLGEGISNYAKQYTGTPYSSSAAWEDGPKNGWGCATATKWLYDSYAGVDVGHPSLSASQYSSSAGSKVDSKMPGDLLFFYYKNGVNTGNPINHVGMYTGGGSMFHARSPELGTEVTGVDATGMDSAIARAGGSAIKRYMPMTIAGLGVPSGKLATGGQVSGKGGPTTDEILAWISNGEYVMNAGAVKHYGKEFMDAVNKGILPEAAMGGMFSSKYPGVVQKMAGGGMLMSKYGKNGMVSSSANVEYNINVNVAGTNASPDEIANRVMQTLKRSDKMKGATIRI